MMKDNRLDKKVEYLSRKHSHKHQIAAVIISFGFVVFFGTYYSLSGQGHAQTHIIKELSCNYEIHQHTDDCYDSEGNLICGYADYVIHRHNDDCYDEEGNLVCTLPEIEPHEHTDSCYEEEKVLVCDQEESQGHVHTDECYEMTGGELICGMEEHTHTDECYDEEGNLICILEEHTHTDECYAPMEETLICGMEEGEGAHTHTDECYESNQVLVCGENELHTHTDECYDEGGNLICGQLELKEHTHDAECFTEREMTGDEIRAMEEELEEKEAAGENGASAADTENAEVSDGAEIVAISEIPESEEPEGETFTQTAETENYIITATYTEAANIPEDATFQAKEITPENDPEAYDEYLSQLRDLYGENYQATFIIDSGFYADGEEYEPEDTVDVQVEAKNGTNLSNNTVTHFKKNESGHELEELSPQVDENGKMSYSQNSFSPTASGTTFSGDGTKASPYQVYCGGTITLNDYTYVASYSSYGKTYKSNSSDSSIATVAIKNNNAVITANSNAKAGTATITLYYISKTSTDWRGNKTYSYASRQIYVTVKTASSGGSSSSGGSANSVALVFDGTNGSQQIYTGAAKVSQNFNIGDRITLPEAWTKGSTWAAGSLTYTPGSSSKSVNDAYYQVQLAGWYDIINQEYYQPGAEYEVTGPTIFYADWIGTDEAYNNGTSTTALSGAVATADTSGFVQNYMFDYNDLWNVYSSTYNSSTSSWSLNTSPNYKGDNSYIPFIMYENSPYSSTQSTSALSQPSMQSSNSYYAINKYSGSRGWGETTATTGIISTYPDMLSRLFDTSDNTIGVHYLGTGQGLFYSANSSGTLTDNGIYYAYDSASHAASYNKSSGTFTVYKDTQTFGGAIGFGPLNGEEKTAYGQTGGKTNYFFGMKTVINFELESASGTGSTNQINGTDMTYYFSGDDDVWVFVDGELVLDMGGIHGKVTGEINFKTGTIKVANQWINNKAQVYTANKSFSAGSHTLTMYYMERGSGNSNCKIQFCLKPSVSLGVQKVDQDNNKINLSGAKFIVQNTTDNKYYAEDATTKAVSWTNSESAATKLETNEAGYLNFRNLTVGSYKLIETDPPANYKLTNIGTIPFNIVPTGQKDNTGADILKVELPQTINGVTVDDSNKMLVQVTNEHIKYNLTVVKKDTDGKALSDAVFRLYENASLSEDQSKVVTGSKTTYTTYTSGEDGKLKDAAGNTSMNLKSGLTYYLVEWTAPSGYKLDQTPRTITVSDSGISGTGITAGDPVTVDGTTTTPYTLTITNEENNVFLKITKVAADAGKDNAYLEGAEFSLYTGEKEDDGTVTKTLVQSGLTSDANGVIYKFKDLPDETTTVTYYLTETKAPDGYQLLTGDVSFDVTYTCTVTDTTKVYSVNVTSVSIPGYGGENQESADDFLKKNESTGTFELQIPNITGSELPATGGIGTAGFTLAGLMMILAALIGGGVSQLHRKNG